MSKIISWILSLVLSLTNGFAPYTPEEKTYTGDPAYSVEKDAANYSALYDWYSKSMSSADGVCTLTPTKHRSETNRAGVGFIIADVPYNAEAKLEFSDEDVIVAPQRCKVLTQPGTNANSIVVENSDKGVYHFKMIIENPKRWFCCEHQRAVAGGSYRHLNADHRVQLEMGDTVAVASSNTKIKLYRGDPTTGELKEVDLPTFLRDTAQDGGGNPDLYVNGKDDIKTTNQEDSKTYSKAIIPANRVYNGYSRWAFSTRVHKWYYGADSGTPGKDYAANQYVIYQSDIYYFDEEGYMVTGWRDGYYYYPYDDYAKGIVDFKQGAMCYNTIVPDESNAKYYVRLNKKGEIDTDTKPVKGQIRAGRYTYVYDSSVNRYVISTTITGKTADKETTSPVNNDTASDIGNQEKDSITEQTYTDILDGKIVVSIKDGWYKYKGSWLYVESGRMKPSSYDDTYLYGDSKAYIIKVDNKWYFMDSNTHLMVSVDTKLTSTSTRNYLYTIADGSMLSESWYRIGNSWIYANISGYILRNGLYTIRGKQYYFEKSGVLDIDRQIVNVDGQSWELQTDGSRTLK